MFCGICRSVLLFADYINYKVCQVFAFVLFLIPYSSFIIISNLPELPEVQTTVNGVNKLKGLIIKDVWTDYGGIIHQGKNHIKNTKYFANFKKKVLGKKIINSTRRAKNVLIHLTGDVTILVHMKMTGHLLYGTYRKVSTKSEIRNSKLKTKSSQLKATEWVAVGKGPLRDDSYNQFIHLVFTLSNKKQLVLSDVRKFAKVCLINTNELQTSPELAHLGPEPLEKNFDFKTFKKCLSASWRRKIKQVLMDQSVIAGIGNIYSDEILLASGVHPLRQVKSLKEKELKNIYKNIKIILKKGIDFRGDSLSDYRNIDGERGEFQNKHKVYGRKGLPCLQKGCHGTIERIMVGGRSAHFCPVHQK